jgi:hypothetical protein
MTCILDLQVGLSMIRIHFEEFEFEQQGLQAPPCHHCAPSS